MQLNSAANLEDDKLIDSQRGMSEPGYPPSHSLDEPLHLRGGQNGVSTVSQLPAGDAQLAAPNSQSKPSVVLEATVSASVSASQSLPPSMTSSASTSVPPASQSSTPSTSLTASATASPSVEPPKIAVNPGYGGAVPEVMVILAHGGNTIEWANGQPYPVTVMEKGRPPGTPNNTPGTTRGREALSYLQYILDHYDALPSRMIFMHDHGSNWHVDVSRNAATA